MEKEKRMIASSSQTKKKIRMEKHELPYDVVEEILVRVPVESIVRFKSVSNQWKSNIEFLCFTKRYLRCSSNPKILFIFVNHQDFELRTMCLDSTSCRVLDHLYIPKQMIIEISGSCDGLVCMYDNKKKFMYVVNPTTRWFRQLPHARFQLLKQNARYSPENFSNFKSIPRLAFAKVISCDYKLVWLYNSDKYNSDVVSPNERLTKCEVFDFKTNAWRYLTCTPSYRIFNDQTPASANGSLYWLTERYNGETKVIVFDLLTETFRLLSENPVSRSHPDHIVMCMLDNRLCMSKIKRGTMIQEIWSLQSDDTWIQIYTIDLLPCSLWFGSGKFSWTRVNVFRPCTPVAICKNKEILLSRRCVNGLMKYDPQTKSYSSFDEHLSYERLSLYYPSLISHI